MTNLDVIEFIDEFLSEQEDVLHGIEGRDCTKSRKYLDMLKKQLSIHCVVKSLPNDEEVKAHIDTLPYYGTCTDEYNEGFEDGVKWLKEQLAK
jgi:hypothetical protein